MSDDLDKAGLDKLVKALDQHLESIKWQEFHFFNPSNGFSKTDLTSIRICLDYEQARESKDVALPMNGKYDPKDKAQLLCEHPHINSTVELMVTASDALSGTSGNRSTRIAREAKGRD